MRAPVIFIALLISACNSGDVTPSSIARTSPCESRHFDGSRFTVCKAQGAQIDLRLDARRFPDLGANPDQTAFAMNAGMFGKDHAPIGLTIIDGKQVHAINRRNGFGNFHLMPNGVFLLRNDGRGEVVTSDRFTPAEDIRIATQSGPMLLIDGKLHPKIDEDGPSHYIRNAVGIAPDGSPAFVISDDAVSFGKIARFMRDDLHMKNALFLDGSVSSLWDPAGERMDNFTDLGPILVVRRNAESARNP